MIKLAMMCNDETAEAQYLDCLSAHKDISIIGSIHTASISRKKNIVDFFEKLVKTPPDISLLEYVFLRQAAALDLQLTLDYVRKLSSIGTRIIVIGDHFHQQFVLAALKEGARGFLLKESLSDMLRRCIDVIIRGEVWLSGDLLGLTIEELLDKSKRSIQFSSPTPEQLARMEAISRREMEIMALVSESMTNEEIAQKLFLSTKTVKTHIRNIFEKTGIRNRVEAAIVYTRFNYHPDHMNGSNNNGSHNNGSHNNGSHH